MKPNLIFLDLNMPKVDGKTALKKIKETPDLKNIPVVIWTTSSSPEDRELCLQLGVIKFITKPVEFSNIVAALGSLKITPAS